MRRTRDGAPECKIQDEGKPMGSEDLERRLVARLSAAFLRHSLQSRGGAGGGKVQASCLG